MKYSKLYIIPVLVAVIASCTKVQGPEGGVSPEGGEVSISASVDAAGSPATRAEGSTPYAGSTLGLSLDYGESTYTQPNVLWTNDGSNNWTSQTKMLWGKASDKVGVYAYAPYDAGQTKASAVEFTIPTDQSEGLGAADLLWWYPGIENNKRTEVTAGSFEGGKIDIAFRHALIKLTVNFELASQFKGKDISIKEAWFHRSGNKVKIDFSSSSNETFLVSCVIITKPDYTFCSIKMHNCSKEGKLACDVLFYPHSLSSGEKLLTVTLSDGRDYILTLDKDLELQKYESGFYVTGIAYEMTVTVGKDKLEMGSVTVAPWTDKGSLGDNFGTDATEYSEWGGPEDVATAYAGGDGSKGNPYQIETAAQLALMAQRVNNGDYYIESTQTNQVTYFKLTSDIDLMGQEWTPIGYEQCSFCGIFDGGGHTILNLNVTNRYAGLFGVVKESAEIKNLTIRNASVKSRVIGKDTEGCSGIVAGKCEGQSSISNCSVEGSSSGNCYVGGIVGRIDKECKIRNCTAVVSCLGEEGSYSECGGIAGKSSATIENCTVRGNIKGTGNVGGFVGTMDGGKITSNTATLSCSYADVSLYSIPKYVQTYNVGGLVGECKGNSEVKVEAAAAVFGTVSVEPGLDADNGIIYLGGYIGYAEYTTLGGHFWGSIEAAKPSNGTLEAGIFMGYFGTGVTTGRSYCMYDKSRVGDLPIYGAKADGAKDDNLANIIAN